MKLDDIRQGVGALWESVTEGWERLRQTATGALTRYRPGDPADLPLRDEIDDASYVPSASWAMSSRTRSALSCGWRRRA
jgi:HSP20 family protein